MNALPVPEPPAPVLESDVMNALKGAGRSAIIVLLTLLIPAVFNFLNELMGWANEGGQAPFPALDSLGWVAVSAVLAAVAAALTFLWRYVENRLGVGLLRSSIPVQAGDKKDDGDGSLDLLIKVIVVVVLVALAVWVLLMLFGNGK